MPVAGQSSCMYTCFCFSTYKNRNVGAAMLVASQVSCMYMFFAFVFIKIVIQG